MRIRDLFKVLVFSALMSNLAGCLTAPVETLRIEPSHINTSNWHVSKARDFGWGKGSIIERVPVGQDQSNWKELISIQFIEGVKDSPSEFVKNLKEQINSSCKLAYWNVIDSDKNGITYEWRVNNCANHKAQHEIARILQGNDGLHRVAYAMKGGEMPKEVRENWIRALSNAYVKKGGNRVEFNS